MDKDDERLLKSNESLNWTEHFKILRVDPSASAPNGKPVVDYLIRLDFPSGLTGANAKRRLSVMKCKPCGNPHKIDE